ncbi:hypothetical protein A6A05_12310 [Magnetospirillum moscoviense]|uniref:Autotransporter domain-containing protein n=1 Tax=Magnetospirillum moscoviense TaxID=1437059 RepID=A0A178MPI6_9PROT|nr:hypothetical protein A6A05_12310 [Magnetospirillum moscoviense]
MVGAIDVILQSDIATQSTLPDKQMSDTYLVAIGRLGTFFTPELSLRSTITFEPVRSASQSRAFQDEGAFIEELNLKWEKGPLIVYGGKFNPGFGLAGKFAPGLYGADFAGDYLVREAIGAGGSYAIDAGPLGTLAPGAAVFFLDNTFLSNAYITRARYGQTDSSRYRAMRGWYGGVGNTESPSSFALTLDASDIPALPGLELHLGYDVLRHGQDGTQDQMAQVAGARYPLTLSKAVTLTPIAEYARIQHVGGAVIDSSTGQSMNQDARYITFGIEATNGGWSASAVRSYRWNIEPDDGTGLNGFSNLDRTVTASAGYTFAMGLGIAIGWKRTHTYDSILGQIGDTETWGVQSTYGVQF